MLLNTQNIALKLFLSLALISQLSACVPVVVGGAAAAAVLVCVIVWFGTRSRRSSDADVE